MKKVIWRLWNQGWDNAPSICRKCSDSWAYQNPDWEIRELSKEDLNSYVDIEGVLPGLKTNNICYSDIVRIFLLKEHGGVWCDSTVFCNKPLDKWLTHKPFLFSYPFSYRMIASWFISSGNDPYIIDSWYNRVVEYWKYRIAETDQMTQHVPNNNPWFHELFQQEYFRNQVFKARWDSVEKIQCPVGKQGPLQFAPDYLDCFFGESNPEFESFIDSQTVPVFKLSYKIKTDWRAVSLKDAGNGSNKIDTPYREGGKLDYIINTIK